jgi:hypothetical protein
MAETGMVGHLPRPAEPFVFSLRNVPSCKMLTDILHVWDLQVAPTLRRFEAPTADELAR